MLTEHKGRLRSKRGYRTRKISIISEIIGNAGIPLNNV